MKTLTTRCCIAGGGPAGVMLGYLLARSGVDCIVLEKHKDFFRDFRGDTIHPSTMEALHELGILKKFLKLDIDKTKQIKGFIGNTEIVMADFSHLPVHGKFIAFIPQWDFLDFLSDEGKKFPSFQLLMETEVQDIIKEKGKVVGVRGVSKGKPIEIRSELVVGADGRRSIVRKKAGLKGRNLGAPMDVLWFRLSRKKTDAVQSLGRFDKGQIIIMLNRGDYWQCGFVIAKNDHEEVKKQGIEAFRAHIVELAPVMKDRVQEIQKWDDVKLLTVSVDCLETWYMEGLLCIGDSAHAMSPIAGVGINLAIQDAVAAANILVPAFKRGTPTTKDLAKVQKRRMFPTKMTQRVQLFIQNKVIAPILEATEDVRPAWPFRLLRRFPILRRIPARFIGMGFRPEHVQIK